MPPGTSQFCDGPQQQPVQLLCAEPSFFVCPCRKQRSMTERHREELKDLKEQIKALDAQLGNLTAASRCKSLLLSSLRLAHYHAVLHYIQNLFLASQLHSVCKVHVTYTTGKSLQREPSHPNHRLLLPAICMRHMILPSPYHKLPMCPHTS